MNSDKKVNLHRTSKQSSGKLICVRFSIAVSCLLLMVYVFAGWALYQSRKHYHDQASISAQNLAQALAINAKGILDKLDAGLFAINLEITRQINTGTIDDVLICGYLTRQKAKLQDFEGLWVADTHGDLRWGTELPAGNPVNIADREYFCQLKSDSSLKSVLSKPVIGRITKTWSVLMATRVSLSNDSFAGAVLGSIRIVDYFTATFSSVNIGAGGNIELRNDELGLLVRFPQPENLDSLINSKDVPAQTLMSFKKNRVSSTYTERSPLDNQKKIVCYQKVADYPLYVFASQNLDNFLVPCKKQIIITTILVILLTFIAISSMRLFYLRTKGLFASQQMEAQKNALELEAKVRSSEIAERRKTEHALRESEDRYRKLFDSSPDGIVLIGQDGTILRANIAQSQIYGYESPNELIGMKATNLVAPSDRDYSDQILQRRLNGDIFPPIEYEVIRKDGTTFFAEVSAATLENIDGTISGYICVTHDITDRKKSQEALQVSKNRLKLALQSAQLGIWDLDLKTNVMSWDDRMLELYGVKRELFVNTIDSWITRLHPDDVQQALDEYRAAIEGSKGFNTTFRVCHPDGKIIHIKADGMVMRDAFGSAIRMIGINKDITESVKAQALILNSQKLESLGILAGGIAHDFNNILGAIIGYADMSKDDAPNDSRIMHNLDQILKSADRASNLVRQILAFSRQHPDDMNPIYVSPTVKEVIQMLRASLPATIDIKNSVVSDTLPVMGNSTQLYEVIMNLCINASHAMNGRGIIEITHEEVLIETEFTGVTGASAPGNYSTIMVKDNGSGIPADVLPHIFEPYYTTKAVGDGTGLGLAVVAGIIKGHNGNITIDTEWGKGTTFRVYLKKCSGNVIDYSKMNSRVQYGTERVMFIDDEKILCEIAEQMLVSLGYKVTTYSDGVKALDHFSRQPENFDIIITDQTMPVITGIELSKEFLRIRNDIPIMVCSGFSNEINEKICLEAGIRMFVAKPLNKNIMASQIRVLLDNTSKGSANG